VGLLARARKEHRTVRAFGLSEHYREIFAITRLSDFMGIYPDEDSAVTAAAATSS
jgi:anti-anti-sigma regulatory factor